jgi:signal transduction histidine kinase
VTRGYTSGRPALSVGQRLFLGLLPSLLAVELVVGLAYYGEYGRQAPGRVVLGAAALALASLAMTWVNTRYLASRIARLASAKTGGATTSPSGADELDRIEQVVDQLGSALSASEVGRRQAETAASARLREHATMLSATVRSSVAQLDDVRLPLHILLDAKFGDLNENQEELLGTARDAADVMDTALRRLGQVADADRGAIPVQRELVQVNDVVRAVLPLAQAAAARRGARVDVTLEPGLARAVGDRVRLAEALAFVLEAAAADAGTERPLTIATARDQRRARIDVSPVADHASDSDASHALDVALACRLIEAQGGTVSWAGATMSITLG